jgi:hypothetical protein
LLQKTFSKKIENIEKKTRGDEERFTAACPKTDFL